MNDLVDLTRHRAGTALVSSDGRFRIVPLEGGYQLVDTNYIRATPLWRRKQKAAKALAERIRVDEEARRMHR
jgi:hypothetical protein